ncbi:MAG TPA: HRDC domain-containing protein [Anaerolineae bacterium]|nr:HRDC domain-containing protein [Anaerolineae bacterium]
MTRSVPVLVTTMSAFEEMFAQLREQPRIAVDTEADSLYSYYEKVCLVQFSIPSRDFILDTLSVKTIEPLGELFADPTVEMVFHAAEYDILSLKRDYGFTFETIFDTMVAARVLGWKHVGLGSILEEHFGVKLDKRFQRADWGKRPLSRELIEYARDDTYYLLRLYDLQIEALKNVGRLDEARAEFERLTRVEWSEREFDPNRYWTLEGARDLDPMSLGALRELYAMREGIARKEDRPPFKVIANATLVRVARTQPRTIAELSALPGVGEWFVRRHGREALRAIERGRAYPQNRLPKPTRGASPLADPASRDRYARLKEWRKARAQARGVEPDVIVSNDALVEVARVYPQTPEALEQILALGEWKAREYGEELLRVLNGQ